jgi:transcriptional regulator with XRE-family HTH domain
MAEPARIGSARDQAERSPIGARLREARELQGISLREVASSIGVSKSLISQIERDKVTPSVGTLWALVTQLGLTMGDVFPAGKPPAGALAAPPALPSGPMETPETRAAITLESGVRWERLTSDRDPLVEFLYVVYPVGATSCPEDSLMRHGGKEYGYVISGRLGVRVGFDEYELGPGGSISFDSSSPHRLRAIGDQAVEAIWAVVGRQGDGRALPH